MPTNYGNGLTDEDIKNAVLKSGYPLQTEIANQLKNDFFVQEEWSYIDKDSESHRALDIAASLRLWDHKKFQPYVRPELHLLIECKKSEMPYVFFLSKGKVFTHDFPVISGLKENNIVITSNDTVDKWNYPTLDLMGMTSHPFLSDPPFHCMTFSKCVRKGKDVILSGEEPYNSIILPLMKSALHHIEVSAPPKTAVYFDCNIVIPVAVIDAPLVGVVSTDDDTVTQDLKWVRVYRHSYKNEAHKYDRQSIYGCDIVKKEFFGEYLESNVLPFAKRSADLIIKHHKVISSGSGFVSDIMSSNRRNVEPVLVESTISKDMARQVNIGKRIIAFIRKFIQKGITKGSS